MSSLEEYKLRFDEGTVTLDADHSFTVYGEVMFAVDLIEQDFGHLSWLDQILVIRDLEMNREISTIFHPEVLESLYTELEASPYYGKDRFEVEAVYRRLNTVKKTEDATERKMMKPVEWTATMVSKRGKVVGRLVVMGFDRVFARETVKKFLAEKGEGVMNLTVNTIADKVDEYIRDVTAETEKKYITKDSNLPCDIYLVKFTDKDTNEQFIKVGITRRGVDERFSQDKNDYNIEILYVVNHKMSEAIEREKHILSRCAKHKYMANCKLKGNGDTELLSLSVDTNEIIQLMGTKNVK